MDNVQNSIIRAQRLFNTSDSIDNYFSIKIKPSHGGCCCFHCWPHTWREVNTFIQPSGPLEDEGDVLVKNENNEYVLECHESGPEIIVLIDRIINYSSFVISVAGLIIALLQNRQKEKPGCVFEIIKRKFKNGSLKEEVIIRTEYPLIKKDDIEKTITKHLKE
jgi:hypothetical protein